MKHALLLLTCLSFAACTENPFGVSEVDAAFRPVPDAAVPDSGVFPDAGLGEFDCGDFSQLNLDFESPDLPASPLHQLVNGAEIQNGVLLFSFQSGGYPAGDSRIGPALNVTDFDLQRGGRLKAKMTRVPDGSNAQMMLKVQFTPTLFTELVALGPTAQLRTVVGDNPPSTQSFDVTGQYMALYATPELVAAETSTDGVTWTRVAQLPGLGAGRVGAYFQAFYYGPTGPGNGVPGSFMNIDDINVNCTDR